MKLDSLIAQLNSVQIERFWSRVEPTGFCWNWSGTPLREYGVLKVGIGGKGYGLSPHRIAYLLLMGELPDGPLDHLCRNTMCVNPDHLEPVSHGENNLRGFGIAAQNARKTHCKNNHEFTLENTHLQIVHRNGIESEMRVCRTCRRDSARLAMRAKRKSITTRR